MPASLTKRARPPEGCCYRRGEHFPSRHGSRASTHWGANNVGEEEHHRHRASTTPKHLTRATATSYLPSPPNSYTHPLSQGGASKEVNDAGAPLPPKPKFWVFTRDRQARGGGIYLKVALKKGNDAGSIVDIVATTVGQGVARSRAPSSVGPTSRRSKSRAVKV